jgi:hypothetical protein
MRYSSRFFLYAPVVMFVSLAAAVMIWWWIAATALDKQLDAVNGREAIPGVKISFTSKKIAGFPFRLDTILQNLRIEVATTQGPFVWRTEHFASHALNYGRDQAIYEAAGRQEISWRDDDGKLHDFAFVSGWLRASSIAANGTLVRFDLDIVEIASPDLGAGRVQFHIRRDPAGDALDFAASGETIKLGADLRAGFGDTLAHVLVVGKLAPGKFFAPLLSGKSDWRRATEEWRNHNGALSIDRLEVKWNKLSAEGHGALALDATHRLNGKIALDLDGTKTLVAGAAGNGKLAAAVDDIAAMESKAAEGTLPVPLAFQSGSASLGNQPAGYVGPLY